MNSYKVYKNLNGRQINAGNTLFPDYKTQIIKNYYASSKNLYNFKCSFKVYNNNFCFSPNGNYMSVGNSVFALNESLSFLKFSEIEKKKISKVQISSFNQDSSKIIEYGYNIYKEEFFLVNDIAVNKFVSLFPINWNAHNISTHPFNPNLFATSSTDNELFLNDLRCSGFEKMNVDNIRTAQYNPVQDHLMLVTSTSENNLFTFDLRNHRPVFYYNMLYSNRHSFLLAKYSKNGNQIFLVMRRSRPLLFNTHDPYPIFEFDELGYSNFINAKYCCFAGPEDEYAVATSDDNNVFVWEIPTKSLKNEESNNEITLVNSAKFILRNFSMESSVEYNYQRSILGCLNFHGNFNFWSPFPFNLNLNDEKIKNSTNVQFNPNISLVINDESDKSNLFNLMIFKVNILIFYILKHTLRCLDKNYFVFEFDSFLSINSKCFISEFKRDLNINYIKSYINNQISQKNNRKHKLLKMLQKNFDPKISFKYKIFKYDFITTLLELFKYFFSEDFINKSIIYLEEQLYKLKKLKKELLALKLKELDWDEKINSLKKIKVVLKSMIFDLKFIINEDNYLYENKFSLIKKMVRFLIDSSYRQFSSSYYNKLVSKFDKSQFEKFEGDESLRIKRKFTEIEELSSKMKKKSELFDEDLNENLLELKNNFKLKKINILT